jgi:phosphoglycolate phosphatase/putative hydrolase of the HAD superfamily
MPYVSSNFPETVRAVIFDMDGTLYNQRSLRRAMARTLALAILSNPREQIKTIRFLQAYREAQEHLRHSATVATDLAKQQLELACTKSDTPKAKALEYMLWFDREPLKHLGRMVNEEIPRFVQQAKSNGLALGVYSDYPPAEKLKVLGLSTLFDVISCSSDPEIGRFKPNPVGLQHTLQRLGVAPDAAVYVGDRMDVDAPCAMAAGVHAIILDKSRKSEDGVTRIRTFGDLMLLFRQKRIFS